MRKRRVPIVNSCFALQKGRSWRQFTGSACLLFLLSSNTQSLQGQSSDGLSALPNRISVSLRGDLLDGSSESAKEQAKTSVVNASVIRVERLPAHREYPVVTAISVASNGDWFAAAGDDHAIRIVDLATGKTKATLIGHHDWVQCVEFSPNNELLASCSNDGTLCIWAMGKEPRLLTQHEVGHALLSLTFLDDEQIYTAGFDSNVYRLNLTQGKMVIDHRCECNDIRSIACSPDHHWVAYGGRDGVVRIRSTVPPIDAMSGHDEHSGEFTIPVHFDRIRSLQFSPDNQTVTSVGEDRRIVHYDILQKKVISQSEIGGGKLMGLCQLEPNLFAIAGSDNSIRIFSDLDKRVLVKLIGHDGSVCVLKKTNNRIVSGSFDTTIRIWDIDQAISGSDPHGRYVHPVAAQFEDSGAGDEIK